MRASFRAAAVLLVGTAGLLFASAGSQAGEITRGIMLSISCAGCHGTDGKSPGAMPSLNGKSAEFIESALKEFRSGQRESTVMIRHAKGYSDEEIKLIAQYLATIK
jgi:cytochrome subunit of sulfide dehydrogenase